MYISVRPVLQVLLLTQVSKGESRVIDLSEISY